MKVRSTSRLSSALSWLHLSPVQDPPKTHPRNFRLLLLLLQLSSATFPRAAPMIYLRAYLRVQVTCLPATSRALLPIPPQFYLLSRLTSKALNSRCHSRKLSWRAPESFDLLHWKLFREWSHQQWREAEKCEQIHFHRAWKVLKPADTKNNWKRFASDASRRENFWAIWTNRGSRTIANDSQLRHWKLKRVNIWMSYIWE